MFRNIFNLLVYIYPVGAAAAEMATATADDVYVHRIQCCIRGYHIPADLVPDQWRNPGICSRAGQHARLLRCGGVPSNVLARVHPWVSFEKSWLSFVFRARLGLSAICDMS